MYEFRAYNLRGEKKKKEKKKGEKNKMKKNLGSNYKKKKIAPYEIFNAERVWKVRERSHARIEINHRKNEKPGGNVVVVTKKILTSVSLC